MSRKSPFSIKLTSEEQRVRQARARQYTSSYRDMIRAKIVLLATQDLSNDQIARCLDPPPSDRQQVAQTLLPRPPGWSRRAAPGRPWERKFLGFRINRRGQREVAPQSVERLKQKVREIWRSCRSVTSRQLRDEWRRYIVGWWGYDRLAEDRRAIFWLEGWIRRHIRPVPDPILRAVRPPCPQNVELQASRVDATQAARPAGACHNGLLPKAGTDYVAV